MNPALALASAQQSTLWPKKPSFDNVFYSKGAVIGELKDDGGTVYKFGATTKYSLQEIHDEYDDPHMDSQLLDIISQSLNSYYFVGHPYIYNQNHYRKVLDGKPVIRKNNITLTESYLLWNKSDLSKKY